MIKDTIANVWYSSNDRGTPFVGERLRLAREYLGFSCDASAEQLGVSRSLVVELEEGSIEVSDELLSKCAILYKRTIDWFTHSQRQAESMVVESLTPPPKGFDSNDWEELRTFEQILGSMPDKSKETDDIERLSSFLGDRKRIEELHQELNTYNSSLENGYVDIFQAVFRLGITLILRPLKVLGSILKLKQQSGLILSVDRSVNELRFATASALVRLMCTRRISGKSADKFWYSLKSEFELNKFERDILKNSLDFLLPNFLLASLQTKQRWSNTDLADPVNMYQASLRLGTSYQATVRAYLFCQFISLSEAKKLLQKNLQVVKRSILEDHLPNDLENINVWLLSRYEEGSVIRANPNDVFVIKVRENGAAGYRWNFSELTDNGFVILRDYNTVKDKKRIGARSLRTILAKPVATEDGIYELEESRPWERNTSKINGLTIPYKRLTPLQSGLYNFATHSEGKYGN